jgi:translation initiation factor IF-1
MVDDGKIEVEGTIISHSHGFFKVQISEQHIATCTISGKIRQHSVRVIEGDRVLCELSPYDLTKGRIVFRLKQA